MLIHLPQLYDTCYSHHVSPTFSFKNAFTFFLLKNERSSVSFYFAIEAAISSGLYTTTFCNAMKLIFCMVWSLHLDKTLKLLLGDGPIAETQDHSVKNKPDAETKKNPFFTTLANKMFSFD